MGKLFFRKKDQMGGARVFLQKKHTLNVFFLGTLPFIPTICQHHMYIAMQPACMRKAIDSLVKQAETVRLKSSADGGRVADQAVTLHIGFPINRDQQPILSVLDTRSLKYTVF